MAIVNQHPAFADLGKQKGTIERAITDSGFLSAFKYDPSSFSLTIVFKNGAEYVYNSVYPMTVDQFQESKNKSEFYAKNIRGKTESSRLIDKNVGPRGGSNGKSSNGSAESSRTNRRGKSRGPATGSDSGD